MANDPRFRSNGQRSVHRAELRPLLEAALAERDAASLCEDPLRASVAAGPARSVPEAFEHPHTARRQMRVELGPDQSGAGVPIKLSLTPGRARTPAPLKGQHSREVLSGLGYFASEITALLENAAVKAAS